MWQGLLKSLSKLLLKTNISSIFDSKTIDFETESIHYYCPITKLQLKINFAIEYLF